jgi:hypothetical protein
MVKNGGVIARFRAACDDGSPAGTASATRRQGGLRTGVYTQNVAPAFTM